MAVDIVSWLTFEQDGCTYVSDDVRLSGRFTHTLCRPVVLLLSIFLLIYNDMHEELGCKSSNLHVVSICTLLGHCVQVSLERGLDIGGTGPSGIHSTECSCIFAFWIPTGSTAGVDHDEVFVVVGHRTHVVDSSSTQFEGMGLVSKELVGESMKETVSYSKSLEQRVSKGCMGSCSRGAVCVPFPIVSAAYTPRALSCGISFLRAMIERPSK